jgi:hypothetical protein
MSDFIKAGEWPSTYIERNIGTKPTFARHCTYVVFAARA